MLKNDSNYQRLRVGGRGLTGNSSYWVGPNHLLVVEVSNYVERYRRFYFRDVQAILIQASYARLGWYIGFGGCAGLTLLGMLATGFGASRDNVLIALWFILFFLFMVGLLINALRGPSCSVHLRTAVQNQKLPGISRWHQAEVLVAALAPLISSAQSSLAGAQNPMATTPTGNRGCSVNEPGAPPPIVS